MTVSQVFGYILALFNDMGWTGILQALVILMVAVAGLAAILRNRS